MCREKTQLFSLVIVHHILKGHQCTVIIQWANNPLGSPLSTLYSAVRIILQSALQREEVDLAALPLHRYARIIDYIVLNDNRLFFYPMIIQSCRGKNVTLNHSDRLL